VLGDPHSPDGVVFATGQKHVRLVQCSSAPAMANERTACQQRLVETVPIRAPGQSGERSTRITEYHPTAGYIVMVTQVLEELARQLSASMRGIGAQPTVSIRGRRDFGSVLQSRTWSPGKTTSLHTWNHSPVH